MKAEPQAEARPESEAEPARREYDRLAADYDRRWSRYLDATLGLALDALPDGVGRVLDVPCGTGEFARRLLDQRPDVRVVGADVSPAMLGQAAGKQLGAAAGWVRADVRALPFDAGAFDAVVSASGLHCFRSPEASLAELRRVLRPEGTLVLIDWCSDFPLTRWYGRRLSRTDPSVIRVYSSCECRTLLEGAGFQVERTDRARVWPAWGLMRLVARARIAAPDRKRSHADSS